jgi:DNA-binding LacI/PurR family transcriptional regulator
MSIHAVAKKAGVSVATISRVFNNPEKVSDTTRERILRIVEELGYTANLSARTLRTNRSKALGVILPTLLNPVFAECLNGIALEAARHGYYILPLTTNYDVRQEEQAVSHMLASNADGVILVVSNPFDSKALVRLKQSNTPYMLAYNRHDVHPYVSVDSEAAIISLVNHFYQLGHRRIAMASGTLHASDRAQQRYKGYTKAMAALGLTPPPLIEIPFVTSVIDALVDTLQSDQRPTALICSNDLLAIRAIRAAHLAGLSVPADISIAGFDGIALGQELTPSLCSIAQPNEEIGRLCVEKLIGAIHAHHDLTPHDSALLPYLLHHGESCAKATTLL